MRPYELTTVGVDLKSSPSLSVDVTSVAGNLPGAT